ncbi:MAG: hypothetical protein ACFFAJ_05950 [Candidatus Hodarchaeota archaeon]
MKTNEVRKANLKVSRIGLGTLAFGHPTKGIQDKKEISMRSIQPDVFY